MKRERDMRKVHRFYMLNADPDTPPFHPSSETIPGICRINHKGSVRTIRYLPGARSIFADEQSETEVGDKVNGESITVRGGVKHVEDAEKNLLEYLRLAGYNSENTETRLPDTTVLYKEFDESKKARAEVEKDEKRIDAEHFVKQLDEEEVEAYYLAISERKDLFEHVERSEPAILRRDLFAWARRNPDNFLKGINDPEVKNKFWTMKGIKEGILDIDQKRNVLKWAKGEDILHKQHGISVVDAFASESLKNDDMAQVMSRVKKEVMPTIKTKKTSVEEVNKEVEARHWLDSMIDEAIDNGVITLAGPWHKLDSDKWKGTEFFDEKFKGRKDLKKALMDNDMEMFNMLTKMLK